MPAYNFEPRRLLFGRLFVGTIKAYGRLHPLLQICLLPAFLPTIPFFCIPVLFEAIIRIFDPRLCLMNLATTYGLLTFYSVVAVLLSVLNKFYYLPLNVSNGLNCDCICVFGYSWSFFAATSGGYLVLIFRCVTTLIFLTRERKKLVSLITVSYNIPYDIALKLNEDNPALSVFDNFEKLSMTEKLLVNSE